MSEPEKPDEKPKLHEPEQLPMEPGSFADELREIIPVVKPFWDDWRAECKIEREAARKVAELQQRAWLAANRDRERTERTRLRQEARQQRAAHNTSDKAGRRNFWGFIGILTAACVVVGIDAATSATHNTGSIFLGALAVAVMLLNSSPKNKKERTDDPP